MLGLELLHSRKDSRYQQCSQRQGLQAGSCSRIRRSYRSRIQAGGLRYDCCSFWDLETVVIVGF